MLIGKLLTPHNYVQDLNSMMLGQCSVETPTTLLFKRDSLNSDVDITVALNGNLQRLTT